MYFQYRRYNESNIKAKPVTLPFPTYNTFAVDDFENTPNYCVNLSYLSITVVGVKYFDQYVIPRPSVSLLVRMSVGTCVRLTVRQHVG